MSDTAPDIAAMQTAIHRRMPAIERFRIAVEMSMAVRELAKARLSQEHPDWEDGDLNRALLRAAFASLPLPPVLG